jgi:ribonuclease Z
VADTRIGQNLITGFSRAMYSNWLWHRPLQILVDAGEGLHLALGSRMFAPTHVLLTHGHSDHILGLPGLVAARRFSKGATDKPLTVLYPSGSSAVTALRTLVDDLWQGVHFPVTWLPMDDGAEHDMGSGRVIEARRVDHGSAEALGYRVLDWRRRLKPELAGLPPAEIAAMARQGRRDEMTERYAHPLFVHSGDAMPLPPAWAAGADLLVHDATFLDAADRRAPIHATTEEALEVARAAGVPDLILHHLSIRYDRATVHARLAAQLARSGFTGRCWLLDEGDISRVED